MEVRGESDMAKTTKEFEWRMQGMLYALKIAKADGIDALEKDIRMRNFLKSPLAMTKQERDNFIQFVTENLYATMLTVVGMVLHDQLGFGKKRLLRFKEKFDQTTNGVFDFDVFGNHYVTLEDYAKYLNEKADLGIDYQRVARCQEVCSYEQEWKNVADIDNIIHVLKINGFEDASEWLQGKKSDA